MFDLLWSCCTDNNIIPTLIAAHRNHRFPKSQPFRMWDHLVEGAADTHVLSFGAMPWLCRVGKWFYALIMQLLRDNAAVSEQKDQFLEELLRSYRVDVLDCACFPAVSGNPPYNISHNTKHCFCLVLHFFFIFKKLAVNPRSTRILSRLQSTLHSPNVTRGLLFQWPWV